MKPLTSNAMHLSVLFVGLLSCVVMAENVAFASKRSDYVEQEDICLSPEAKKSLCKVIDECFVLDSDVNSPAYKLKRYFDNNESVSLFEDEIVELLEYACVLASNLNNDHCIKLFKKLDSLFFALEKEEYFNRLNSFKTYFLPVRAAMITRAISTNLNVPNTLVLRDETGSFAAQTVSMVDAVVSDSIDMVDSTVTSGNINKAGAVFIHNFGTNNTFIGKGAGNLTTTGNGGNIGVGVQALQSLTDGTNNTAVGHHGLASLTSGQNNTAIGFFAMELASDSVNNVAVGNGALRFNTMDNNTAVGSAALSASSTAFRNTALGCQAGTAVTTGSNNVMLGFNAGAITSAGSNNIYIDGAGLTPVDESNFIRIGQTQTDLCVSKTLLFSSTTFNSAAGIGSLQSNTIGRRNTGVGYNALQSNITGENNTGVGYYALKVNNDGVNNAAFGNAALGLSSSDFNTAIGSASLASQTIGGSNTALGCQAGTAVTTGSNNVMLGFNAGALTTTGSNNIYIDGNTLTPVNESNTIRLGKTQTACYVKGIYGATAASGVSVVINSLGKLGTTVSSQDFKHDIRPIDNSSSRIHLLNPVSFVYNDDETGATHLGLIAEEVAEIMPDMVIYENDKPLTVRYNDIAILVLKEVQDLRSEFDKAMSDMRAQINEQDLVIKTLRAAA